MVDEERYDINAKVMKNDREVRRITNFKGCTLSVKHSLGEEHFKIVLTAGLSSVLETDPGPVSEDL